MQARRRAHVRPTADEIGEPSGSLGAGSVYVITRDDLAVFRLGRLPTATRGRRRAEETAERLRGLLNDGDEIPYGEAGRALDVHPNSLRYAAPTGSLLLRWDGGGTRRGRGRSRGPAVAGDRRPDHR